MLLDFERKTANETPNARILVVRGGAIGDFILTLPVLLALNRFFTGCRLEILGYPSTASLAVAGGLAGAVKPLESPRMAGFFVRDGGLDREMAGYFAGFDLVLSFVSDAEGIFRSNIARCTRAQFVQGRHRPNEHEGRHACDVFLDILGGCIDADPTPRLTLPPSDSKRAGSWLAVHPGSGSARKNWPEDRWKTLLSSLCIKSDLQFLLVGGEAEEGRLQRLASHLPSHRFEIADHKPLPELAEVISQCHCFIGHDSGIGHLAAALGLPGLTLWGSASDPVIWHPRSDKFQLLHAPDGLEQLTVSGVEQSLASVWNNLAKDAGGRI